MTKGSLLAGVAVAVLALTACAGTSNQSESEGSEEPTALVLAATIDNRSFAPAELQNAPGQVVQYWAPVYDTLLVRTREGGVAPNAAEDFEYNDDQTQLTLTLREDLKYADGSDVTASAVVEGLELFKSGTASDAGLYANIDISAPDDDHIVFDLAEVDPGFVYRLASSSGVVSNPAGFDAPDIATNPNPAASGAYTLDVEATAAGDRYVYVRNPHYWNPEAYPYDELTIRVMTDPTARVNALTTGQVDVAMIDALAIPEVEAKGKEVTIHSAAWEGLYIYDRDGEVVPALGDARVRQAMNMAFDREAIAETLFRGTVEPSSQIFREGSPAHVDGEEYDYDPEAAKELLAEAGYADGFDLVVPTIPGQPHAALEATIVKSLGDIGIRVTSETVPAEQFAQKVTSKSIVVAPARNTQDNPWVDVQKNLTVGVGANPFNNQRPELDTMIQALRMASTEEETDAAAQEIGQYVFDEAWFVPLYNASFVIGHAPEVKILSQVGINVLPIRNYVPANE
jgi:peptide/nickel transport system substrate-binding protein